jgi:hypothetical protein
MALGQEARTVDAVSGDGLPAAHHLAIEVVPASSFPHGDNR